MTMQEKLLKTQRDNAWKTNSKLVESLGFKLPDDLVNKIKEETRSVSKIVVCTYNHFCDMFPASTMREMSRVMIDNNSVGALPIMYVYSPEAEQLYLNMQREKRQQYTNMKQKCSLYKSIYGLDASENLRKFIMSLPGSIPYKTRFSISKNEMMNLADKPDAITYGDPENEIFAVECMVKGDPTITIYVNDLTYDIVEEAKARHLRQRKVQFISEKLEEDHGVKATDEFKEFVMTLPISVPDKFNFDGSRSRVMRLSMKEGAITYGAMSDDIFAVEHMRKDYPMITFFVKEIDYVKEFADTLIKRLQIDEATASFISNGLDHDRYYGGLERFNDYDSYYEGVTEVLKMKPGDIIHDICQGDVVFSNDEGNTGSLVNRELPSAVLGQKNLLVYYPA